MSRLHGLLSARLDYLNGQVERAATMQVSVADIKARFTAIARLADAGQEVIITNWGRPAYRLLPISPVPLRSAFPDTTSLAMQSKPSQTLVNGLWRIGVRKMSGFNPPCPTQSM